MIPLPKLADWPARALAAAGFLLLLYGGEALLEWHTGSTLIPEPAFLPYRAHYDTAWAFVLCALALFAVIARAALGVAACALAVMLFGAARLLQELFPALGIPLHPMVGGLLPTLQLDDISPPSALGLVLGAGVLLALKLAPYSAVRSVVAAMLAFSLAALAIFLLLGSQSSGPFLYGWLQLDSNDSANAVGFIVLATAAAFFVFFGDGPEATAARKWASLAVWLAVVLGSVTLWQALNLQQSREMLARTQFVGAAVRIELASKLEDRLRLLQRSAERAAAARDAAEQIRVDAPQLLNDVPEFRFIAWADPGLTVRWAAPEGTYSKGANLFGDSRRKWTAATALVARGPVLTESLEILPGQSGFEIYTPVSRGEDFHGLLIGVVMHAGWLESLLADRFTQYSIALEEHGQPIGQARLRERATAASRWTYRQALTIQNAVWTLEVTPTEATVDAAATVLPQVTLVIGVLLATLLAFTMFLFQSTLRRARGAARANRLLALDIEARKQAEQALRESEQETRRVVEEARDFYFRLFSDFPNLVWRADAAGKCDYCNQNWLEFTGRTLEQEMGDGWLEGLHPEDRPAWDEAFQQALRDNRPFEIQVRLRRRNGQYGSIICSCKPYHNMRGDLAGFLCSCYDDTARRQMQAELRASQERMRSFSRHLQAAREEEKTRIARDLHDELGATLTALRMDSSWILRRMPDGDEFAARKSRGIVQMADSAIQFIRRTITELRPSILDNLGLVAALRWQAKEFQGRTGIAVSVEVDPEDIAVDKAHAIVFFRILQEALTNVLKHANASHVTVRFIASENSEVLEVADDGSGMAMDWASKETSHGILGMQERAREFNGDLAINSAAGSGTTVTVTLPRSHEAVPALDLH
jgi:PAS domain S-box-containing protein